MKFKSNYKRNFSWMSDGLVTRDTPGYGKGVYAKTSIKKGSLVMVFGGYVLTRKEEEQLAPRIRDIAITIDRDMVIGVTSPGQLSDADFVNHSCDPNCGIKGQISLVAMKNIKSGEQICFDYGTVLYRVKGAPKYELDCMCGARQCRKKITQSDWMQPALQAKCRGHFPYYIQEQIDKLKKP